MNFLEAINYRKINPSEAKQYRALRLESLQKYPMSFGSKYEEQRQRPKLSFEQFIEESHSEKFIIGAFHLQQLIGICGFFRHTDERCRHRGEIIQMYVQPKHQGKKIGFQLLEATIFEAFKISELEQIELDVVSGMAAANKIYTKIGFQECGIKREFYKVNGVYFDLISMILHRNSFRKIA